MADDAIVFTVRYDRRLCLVTAWRYWQRRLGTRYALELAIGSGLIVLAAQGPYRWIEVALWIAVGVFAVLGAGLFVIHWRRAVWGLEILDPPESTWVLSPETISQRSSLGESAIGWNGVMELWRFPEVWIFIWGRDVYSTIPVAQFPLEARQFAERRVRDTGGRVR